MKKSAFYICISTVILCITLFCPASLQAQPVLPHMFSFDDFEGIIQARKTYHVKDGPCAGGYCLFKANMLEATFRILWETALTEHGLTSVITDAEFQEPEACFPKGRTFAISEIKPLGVGEKRSSRYQVPLIYNIVHVPKTAALEGELTWKTLETYGVLTTIILAPEKSPMAQYKERQPAVAANNIVDAPSSSPFHPARSRPLALSEHRPLHLEPRQNPFSGGSAKDLESEGEISPIVPLLPMQPSKLLSQGLLPDRLDVAGILDLMDEMPREITSGDHEGQYFTVESSMDRASFEMMIALNESDEAVPAGSILNADSALFAVTEHLDIGPSTPEWSTQYRLYYPFPGYVFPAIETWEGLTDHAFMTLKFTRKLIAAEVDASAV